MKQARKIIKATADSGDVRAMIVLLVPGTGEVDYADANAAVSEATLRSGFELARWVSDTVNPMPGEAL